MANALAYLDLGQENFIGIDSSEDPTAFVGLLEKKMSFSLGSTPATNGHNVQTVYNDRRKTLFGSVLHSPAAQWFDSLISIFLNLTSRIMNCNIFWQFYLKTMSFCLILPVMLEKSRKKSMSNWKNTLNYGSNDVPKFLCITEIDWKSTWLNCNGQELFAIWEVM